MGASPLRLLPAAAALAIAGALLPVGAASAAPAQARWIAAPAFVDAAPSEPAPPRIDPASVVHRTPEDGASTIEVAGGSAPPIGLLALLIPILLGGGIVSVVTLRRVR